MLRELLGLSVSVAGLGLSATRAVLPLPRLSPLVPGLVSLVDAAPGLRTAVQTMLGRPAADVSLVLGGAVGHALASGPVALLTPAGQRLCLYRKAAVRRQAWDRFDDATAGIPG
ncbi:MAG TPA: hypothetical protein VF788_07390 [Pseudonocardiaceae bacterium]